MTEIEAASLASISLDYRSKSALSGARTPGPLAATASMLPLLSCWLVLFLDAGGYDVVRALRFLSGMRLQRTALPLAWLAATACSVSAIVYYARRSRSPYIHFCLAVHALSLLLTAVLAVSVGVLLLAW